MKLYVVVRQDLAPGLQAAQACHGVLQFAREQPAAWAAWEAASNTIVLVGVADVAALTRLRERALDQDLVPASFDDPDLAPTLTCVVLPPGPGATRLCRGLRPVLAPAPRDAQLPATR